LSIYPYSKGYQLRPYTLFQRVDVLVQELSLTMAHHAVSEPGTLPYRYSPPWLYPIYFLIIQRH
jgi:hypothetical protein